MPSPTEHPEVTRARNAKLEIARAAAERVSRAMGKGKSLAELNIESGIRGWAEMGVDISSEAKVERSAA